MNFSQIIEANTDPVLGEDLELLMKENNHLSSLKDSTILITGATGLIGSLLIKTLAFYNRSSNSNNRIIALIRNRLKAEMIYGDLLQRDDIIFIEGDITSDLSNVFEKISNIDYIIHTASVTSSKTMVSKPVETLETSLIGTNNILKLGLQKHCKSFEYVSSMEMYGTFSDSINVSEEMLGYIDLLNVRSNYPESKRMCENMCIAYWTEYGVPVKIARLAQTFGAGLIKGENRVFAQFARSAKRRQDIVLHTRGLSEGNYCYTRDAINALFTILFIGGDGEAYNVVNEETHTTIADMASMVCNVIAEGKCKVVYDIADTASYGYAADVKMKLSSAKLRKLGWKPTVGLEEAYRRMIESMDYMDV